MLAIELPDWYISPDRQLEATECHKKILGLSSAKLPPAPVKPNLYEGEIVLLSVCGNVFEPSNIFSKLWDMVVPPLGYSKRQIPELGKVSLESRLSMAWPPFRWVAFNPNSNSNKDLKTALKNAKRCNTQLAGIEILAAALLFPDWISSWDGTNWLYPSFGGIYCHVNNQAHVPTLTTWRTQKQLLLGMLSGKLKDPFWSFPTIRELSV